jgi:hypothetical protein
MLKTLRELKFTIERQQEIRKMVPQFQGCVETKEEAVKLSSELKGFELKVYHVWNGVEPYIKENRYWTVGRDRFNNRSRNATSALLDSRKKRDKFRHH